LRTATGVSAGLPPTKEALQMYIGGGAILLIIIIILVILFLRR
jgi:hypothetical protein